MNQRWGEQDAERRRIRELVGEIEALRRRRQEQWRECAHPEGKRFSQEELCDEVYPSYKNLLLGRSLRLPSREALLRIADYLECSIHATNDLLICAQYLPQVVDLREDEAQAMLGQAHSLIETLPLPALITIRGWTLVTYNQLYRELTGLPPIDLIPFERRTTLHAAFDPELPLYSRIAPDEPTRDANQLLMLRYWQGEPSWYHEPWYLAGRAGFDRLPNYQRMLQANSTGPVVGNAYATMVNPTGIRFRVVPLAINIAHRAVPLAPVIVLTLPADRPAREVYRRVGCAIDENRWEHALKLAAP